MGIDSGVMLVAAILCMLTIPLLLIAAVYFGARLFGSSRWLKDEAEGRVLLDRRLAAGEISVDEYYERESALRSADSGAPPRRRRRG
jgi:hypothetical protein